MKILLTLDATKETIAHLLHAGVLSPDDLAALMISGTTTQEQLAILNGACYGLLHLARLQPDEVRQHFVDLLRTHGGVSAIFPAIPPTPLFDPPPTPATPPASTTAPRKPRRRGRSAGVSLDT